MDLRLTEYHQLWAKQLNLLAYTNNFFDLWLQLTNGLSSEFLWLYLEKKLQIEKNIVQKNWL